MAVQERNSEMVSLLSVDFVRKTDTTYLAGIVMGSLLSLPGLTALWPMQVVLNDDTTYLLPEGGTLQTGGNLNVKGLNIILGQGTGAGGYTALMLLLSAVSGGYATLQGISAAGSSYGDIHINESGGDVYLADAGGLTTFGGTIGEGWNNLSFFTGWGNLGGGWTTGQYKKVGDLVFVRGFVVRTSGVLITIATLPTGYRPPTPDRWAVTTDSAAHAAVEVTTGGVITVVVGVPAAYISLSGIIFSTV